MDDCVEWKGCRKNYGYGWRAWQGKQAYAHRVAYCEAHGLALKDIAGQVVRHKCDNPACVNPDHLVLGTQADNLADMAKRGRSARQQGSTHGRSKLTESQAEEIRERYVPYCRANGGAAIAREFGVHPATVNAIASGKAWKHVEMAQ